MTRRSLASSGRVNGRVATRTGRCNKASSAARASQVSCPGASVKSGWASPLLDQPEIRNAAGQDGIPQGVGRDAADPV